jgi:hypothetical protein
MMRGWDYPILGNAVILGTDEEGNSVDAKSLIDDFKGQLVFLEINNDTNTYKFLKSF